MCFKKEIHLNIIKSTFLERIKSFILEKKEGSSGINLFSKGVTLESSHKLQRITNSIFY